MADRLIVSKPDKSPAALDREKLADLVVAIAKDSDQAAFGELYAAFAPRIKAYLMRLGTDPGSAEDLAQEVMLTVWRKAATFDRTQAAVSTWLFTIARNRRIDLIRRTRRPEFDPEDPALMPEPEIPADTKMSADQRDIQVRKALQSLPAEQVSLLEQAFYADKSHSEIALATGLPLGTVKSRLRLAFGRMRKMLDEGE